MPKKRGCRANDSVESSPKWELMKLFWLLEPGTAFPTQTANGVAVSYAVTLDQVSVGAIELPDVGASITPGLTTNEVLLGMSFLKHIEFTQRGDQLILRQLPF